MDIFERKEVSNHKKQCFYTIFFKDYKIYLAFKSETKTTKRREKAFRTNINLRKSEAKSERAVKRYWKKKCLNKKIS